MKYLVAEKQQTQYFFRVHMDESKTLEDTSPDPTYVCKFTWGLTPPEGQTVTEYLENIKREIGLLVDLELTKLNQPISESTLLSGF